MSDPSGSSKFHLTEHKGKHIKQEMDKITFITTCYEMIFITNFTLTQFLIVDTFTKYVL